MMFWTQEGPNLRAYLRCLFRPEGRRRLSRFLLWEAPLPRRAFSSGGMSSLFEVSHPRPPPSVSSATCGASPPPSCRANSRKLPDSRSGDRRFESSIKSSEDHLPRSSDLPNFRPAARKFGQLVKGLSRETKKVPALLGNNKLLKFGNLRNGRAAHPLA